MPANLPPQYYEEEKKLRTAKTILEKIEIYENLLSIMPKHKGTNRLEGDIKRKIAKLKDEFLKSKSSGGKRTNIFHIEKEGSAQVVIIGEPNVGKSSLLLKLTNATPQIADYPFTTKIPQPGMMNYNNVQIQLIDTPPYTREEIPGWLSDIVRRADAVILVVDLSKDDIIEQIECCIEMFHRKRIAFVKEETSVEQKEIGLVFKPLLIIGNKSDIIDINEMKKILNELYNDKHKIIFSSNMDDNDGDVIKENIFKLVNLIRIFTKQPGKEPDLEIPFTIKNGSKLSDLGALIHKDFEEKMKFARVWGKGKFDAQRVHKNYILQDGDIVEFHLR